MQQRLVTISLEARLAADQARQEGSADLHEKLCHLADSLDAAFEELRAVARTIHPAVLSHGGIGVALRSLARGSPVPVTIEVPADVRISDSVALAAYFIAAEALLNTAQHAQAGAVEIRGEVQGEYLELAIRDDGAGGADPAGGSGLTALSDRAQALGGTVRIMSERGQGTLVVARLPLSARESE